MKLVKKPSGEVTWLPSQNELKAFTTLVSYMSSNTLSSSITSERHGGVLHDMFRYVGNQLNTRFVRFKYKDVVYEVDTYPQTAVNGEDALYLYKIEIVNDNDPDVTVDLDKINQIKSGSFVRFSRDFFVQNPKFFDNPRVIMYGAWDTWFKINVHKDYIYLDELELNIPKDVVAEMDVISEAEARHEPNLKRKTPVEIILDLYENGETEALKFVDGLLEDVRFYD